MTSLSTAGAIPVINEKGKESMLKVKVQRYVSGREPDYAAGKYAESSSDESEEEALPRPVYRSAKMRAAEQAQKPIVFESNQLDMRDRRLQRLQRHEEPSHSSSAGVARRPRHLMDSEESNRRASGGRQLPSSSEEEGEDDNEESIRHRRELIKQRRLLEEEQSAVVDMDLSDEKESAEEDEEEKEEEEEEEEESEYASESEDDGPRLKPIFIPKKDRITLQQKKMDEQKEREFELERKRAAEELRRQALKIIEEENRREMMEEDKKEEDAMKDARDAVNTDDENEVLAYEEWKLRELKRIKREKEEREALQREKEEIERIHAMSEQEREELFRNNPRIITNKAPKGTYKFLQKYYHRGAFYMDKDDETFKRDFARPTLDDHFDKTVLPKIMQVKNFGRSGRTKYTHLVDQDTTKFDSPWVSETPQTSKFLQTHAGGMKQIFDKPTRRRK